MMFGDPDFMSWMLFRTPIDVSLLTTADGVICGSSPIIKAATPETWGHAMDVPLIVAVPVVDLWLADTISEPGANRSKHFPHEL